MMDMIKKIIAGFFICHITFLSLIYLHLFRLGVLNEWDDTFIYAFMIFSYIPVMALLEYFMFYIFINMLHLRFSIRIATVSVLTVLVNSVILYFQSKEMIIAGITAISTLMMCTALPFINRKKRTETKN
ncbi:hypothetical protein CHH92_17745 [Bacillus sonorensis]|uniref:Uncharacterized protein n=2 Tax=Bacillus sonorensis TaxID=119858 RepID=M5PEI0_9BACI|nr:hypothetical protein S101395_02640 [Bacillus sonorensis]EME75625.1 hypothetical protein BSONL12_04903 [Bacillus sonorensis L12]MBG9915104.1 hypothetical protein [Bacillus sonorensis]PAD58699.1 hypothetical protein CHH92_17745 [Bacillus sonorensis]